MSKAHALQRIKGGLVYVIFLVAYTVAVLMRPGLQDDVRCNPPLSPRARCSLRCVLYYTSLCLRRRRCSCSSGSRTRSWCRSTCRAATSKRKVSFQSQRMVRTVRAVFAPIAAHSFASLALDSLTRLMVTCRGRVGLGARAVFGGHQRRFLLREQRRHQPALQPQRPPAGGGGLSAGAAPRLELYELWLHRGGKQDHRAHLHAAAARSQGLMLCQNVCPKGSASIFLHAFEGALTLLRGQSCSATWQDYDNIVDPSQAGEQQPPLSLYISTSNFNRDRCVWCERAVHVSVFPALARRSASRHTRLLQALRLHRGVAPERFPSSQGRLPLSPTRASLSHHLPPRLSPPPPGSSSLMCESPPKPPPPLHTPSLLSLRLDCTFCFRPFKGST
jgi:hypothetical protein